MAKPFKSEFDRMAETYGTISYKKQAIINEYTSPRSVIGYSPQVINEDAEGGALRGTIGRVEALTASISESLTRLESLMDSEEMVEDDDLSIGAAATNALENIKERLNNIV